VPTSTPDPLANSQKRSHDRRSETGTSRVAQDAAILAAIYDAHFIEVLESGRALRSALHICAKVRAAIGAEFGILDNPNVILLPSPCLP